MTWLDAFKAFVEEVRSRNELVDVIGRDIELRRVGSVLKGLSPFCAEKHPSLVVWPATQTWHDYAGGGGTGGDVFSYVQEREKVGFKQAVLLLAERAGVKPPNQDDESWQRALAQTAERREIERLLSQATAYYHQQLPADIRAQYYHQHYGFTDETIDELKLGWADGRLFEHWTQAGVSRRAALATGLFVQLKDKVVDFFQHRLVFPYWRGGRVVYFTARATDLTPKKPWEQAKYKKLRTRTKDVPYISDAVGNDYFFNEDAARGADELVITEGTPDCISAQQCGIACISTGTTNFRAQDLPRLLELTHQTKRVVICNDAEVSGAGDTAAIALAEQLWAHGREACIATIPRAPDVAKVDLNELVVAGGADALRAVLTAALPYPEYLLAQIPEDTPPNEIEARLAPLLSAIGTCSPIRADVVLDAISKRFGVRRRALVAATKQLAASNTTSATSGPSRAPSRPAPAAPSPPGRDGEPPSPPTGQPPRGPRRPQIVITHRHEDDIANEAGAILVQANRRRIDHALVGPFERAASPLFLRGEALVRLKRINQPTRAAPMLADVSEPVLRGMLTREIDWMRETHDGLFPTSLPRVISTDLLAFPPSGLPVVDSVITTPTFCADGSLARAPGLYQADALWLDPDPSLQIGDVPANPSQGEIAAARALLLGDLLVDFPFASAADLANAVAVILLPFMRRMIRGNTPLHVVEAPAVGSGKGLFCHLLSIITTGSECPTRTLPESEEEVRKSLTAELITGRPIILLDNADDAKPTASVSLASILTTSTWTDRILGRTEMVTVPNNAVWILTGNNPQMSRDLARRSVRIRLDAKVEHAWLRKEFKHKRLMSWTTANRAELVRAVLILIQAWIAAGRPRADVELGAFEEWATTMGGVLTVAGVKGFLEDLGEMYSTADADSEGLRELVSAWWSAFGNATVYVADLTDFCVRHNLLAEIFGAGNPRSQQTRLGQALRSARGRIFDGLEIVMMPATRDKRTRYALQRLGAVGPAQAQIDLPVPSEST
jgi:DNA primase catalytic core